ncbi:MAG: tetratricopeptide repeat protein [Desulfobacteraceae bacterium]|nr:MAG: tetratricopeptide repeat protein [Desulfobacteraceae bacterium]
MTAAYELFDQILDSGASSETLYILISKIKEEGDAQRVIEFCSKALQQYPANIPLRQMLVEALFTENYLSQAQAEAEEVIRNLDPFIPIYKLLAKIYLKQERRALGFNILKQYLFFQPNDREAQTLLQELAFEKEEPEPPVEKPRPQSADELEGLPMESTPAVSAAEPTAQSVIQLPGISTEEAPAPVDAPAPISAGPESVNPFESTTPEPVAKPAEKVDLTEFIEKNDISVESLEHDRDQEEDEHKLLESMEETGMSETVEEKIQLEPSFEQDRTPLTDESLETEMAELDLDEEAIEESKPEPALESSSPKTEPAPEAEPAEYGPHNDDFYYFAVDDTEDLDDLPEIATPTLAEIYFNQGLVQDALNTYEKVILKNPQDRRSHQRLQEIKADAPAMAASKVKIKGQNKKKKEKLISILDDWLGKIRNISK